MFLAFVGIGQSRGLSDPMSDADPAAASSRDVSELGTSARVRGSTPLPNVGSGVSAVPKSSGEFPGASIAERVAERRRGGTAAAPPVGAVSEQVTEPTAPTEGLTLNFLATQLMELQDKFKKQEAELMESRRIQDIQRGRLVQPVLA